MSSQSCGVRHFELAKNHPYISLLRTTLYFFAKNPPYISLLRTLPIFLSQGRRNNDSIDNFIY